MIYLLISIYGKIFLQLISTEINNSKLVFYWVTEHTTLQDFATNIGVMVKISPYKHVHCMKHIRLIFPKLLMINCLSNPSSNNK